MPATLMFPRLFEPCRIGRLSLKNRIVMPAMQLNIGLRGRRARGYYEERARGGAGIIITGATSVDALVSDEAWGKTGNVASFIEGIRPLADAVHQHGTKIGMQIVHHNRLPAGIVLNNPKGEPVVPSAREDMRPLTQAEIQSIVAKFATAAVKAKEAGFDFVEFHGAHESLACQFFSPLDNRRQDKYGGDLAGRMRFGLECVAAMRAALGPDYPLLFRLGAWEDAPGGITLDDSAKYAAMLEKGGIDALDVSVGPRGRRRLFAEPSRWEPLGTFAWLAQGVKQAVKVPVIAVGRINIPEVAEAILAEAKADLVAIGRQLIADPFWPTKVAQGRVADIVACDSCSQACRRHIERNLAVGCKVNPRVGREWEIPRPE